MSDRLTSAIERARSVLGYFATESIVKGIWGSPAGKTHLARRIMADAEGDSDPRNFGWQPA